MTDTFSLNTKTLSNYLTKHSTKKNKYVLRRKPPGRLLRGAHAVDREFKILSALYPTPLPVAQALHICEDDSVIGSMFYVMEFMQGRVLWDPTLPEVSKKERTAIYHEMNRVLSELHKVNIDDAGLSDYGKKGDYFARQTHTWAKNYKASETIHMPAMETLIEWLPANMPEEDGLYSITHGDYRLDNMMFHPERPEVIAVLDWELSTMYCQRMGFKPITNWNFYLAFSLFRLASICQGVAKRAKQGNASSDKAAEYGDLVSPLANIALGLTNVLFVIVYWRD